MTRLVLAAASATLLSIAVRPWPATGYLAWIALVPLMLAIVGERRPWRGALYAGLVWAGGGWVAYEAAIVVLPWSYPVLVVATSTLWAGAGAATVLLARRCGDGAALAGFPMIVVGIEFVASSRVLFGDLALIAPFGYLQHDTLLRPGAAWSGVSGVSYAVLMTNAAVVFATKLRRQLAAACALLPAAAFAVVPVPGHAMPPEDSDGLRIGLVQAALPRVEMDMARVDRDAAGRVLAAFEALTDEVVGAGVDIVLWGETVVPSGIRRGWVDQRVASAIAAAPVALVGAREYSGRSWHNSVVLWRNGWYGSVYRKRTLVPLIETAVTRGIEVAPLELAGHLVGLGICIDSMSADVSRGYALAGADVLVYLSDDTFGGRTVTSALHASMTAFRAAETNRPAVFVNESGPSAVFDAFGAVVARLPTGATGSLTATVHPAGGTTPFVRWGDWFGGLALSAAIAVGLTGAVTVDRRRAASRSGPTESRGDASPPFGG